METSTTMTLTAQKALQNESVARDANAVARIPAAAVCKKMRTARPNSDPCILLIVDQLTELGGGERMLFELARELPHHGFRIAVVTFRGNVDPAAFKLCPSITILPFPSCFSMKALHAAQALRKLIRTQNVRIVQTFFETSDLYGALIGRLAGVSCIVSSRRDMGILRSSKHQAAYRLFGRLYSAVLTVSDQVRTAHIAADHLAPYRVRTIYNGVALQQFDRTFDRAAIRSAFGLPCDAPLITTVTNINAWKGVDVFLRMAAIVLRTCPEAAFAIAGDWTDKVLVAELQQKVWSSGIADRIHFLGRVADVPSLLLASDVFALLSRSEGFPNVVLEAMAASLPVIATAVGGTPEAIEDGVTGFLVEDQDAEDAAGHMIALLSDQGLRRTIGAAGRKRVEDRFSLQRMVGSHVELYDELLATHS